MRNHGIAIGRWLLWHRHELLLTSALAGTLLLLFATSPPLLLVAAVEWKQARGRRSPRLLGLAVLATLLRAVVWLWRELRGVPHGAWHPCVVCGAPIEAPSRAWYCSPGCRRHARLEREAQAFDPDVAERAAEQLRRLHRPPAHDPALAEIPF
jgi:hypothetical protein